MSVRAAGIWNLGLSLGVAALILLMSLLIDDKQLVIQLMLVMVGLWLIPFAWLVNAAQRGRQ